MASAIALSESAFMGSQGRVRLAPTTLECEPGAITAIVGPNGAGKSTLLAMAAGTLRPTSGSVHIGGQDIAHMDARELAQQRAVLTQDQTVSFGFTVTDVVGWGRTPWRRTENQKRDQVIVQESVNRVRLTHVSDRPINELSGGERKRVHLARVIAQATPIVMMDEPDSDLDLSGLATLDAVLQDLRNKGTAVIMTSHDLRRVSRIADHVVLIAHHRVVAHGTAREVLSAETLSQAYGTSVSVTWDQEGMTDLRADQ